MKLKAAASRNLPASLLEAMNSRELVLQFHVIIADRLSVNLEDIGPATHFVQETDLTIPLDENKRGINVALTMVSTNRYRSSENFAQTLRDIRLLYAGMIQRHIPVGQGVQLFCVLALDGEIEGFDGKPTRLLEMAPEFVEGFAPKSESE